MLRWMAWTPPVAIFFGTIVLVLIGMTVWEIKSPSITRRGFLPIATTRGDRLFIGLLSMAFANLGFVAFRERLGAAVGAASPPSMLIGLGVSLLLLLWIMRKG